MMIHLELLKMDVADTPAGRDHVSVIAAQLRRLDDVVQGFLRFTRPEELRLQPVPASATSKARMPTFDRRVAGERRIIGPPGG